jgi:hypothetical protein
MQRVLVESGRFIASERTIPAMNSCGFMRKARPLPARCAVSCRRCLQTRHSEQVIRGADDVGGKLGLRQTHEAALTQAANRLHPAEDLLHPFALTLADGVALVACRARVKSRRAATLHPGDVGRDLASSEQRDEGLGVIALVGAERAHVLASVTSAVDQRRSCLGLGKGGIGYGQIDEQAVAILHQRVCRIGQLRRLSVALAHKLGLRIGARLVGGVTALLAAEIDHSRAVATASRRFAVLTLEALERSPRLDQCAIDGEVLIGQQTLRTRLIDHAHKEQLGDFVLDQPAAVDRERRVIERALLQIHVEEPPKQDVVVEHLAKQPLRAHCIQRDQQARLEQAFRRYGRTASIRIHRCQRRAHRREYCIGLRLYRPQRMVLRYPLLDRKVAEQSTLRFDMTAHRCSPLIGVLPMTNEKCACSGTFSTPC